MRRAFAVLGLALLVMALNVGASVLYMVFYGHVIAPGREPGHYDAHVQIAAPWSSIIAGAPLMFFAARWSAPHVGKRGAVMIAVAYIAIDLAVLLASGAPGRIFIFAAASFATKLAAAWAGARSSRSS